MSNSQISKGVLMSDVLKKINKFLGKKMMVEHIDKLKENYASFIPIKKLQEADWGSEPHLMPMAIECMKQIAECDDEMSKSFVKKLSEAFRPVCEAVIKMYMVSNDRDALGNDDLDDETEEDEDRLPPAPTDKMRMDYLDSDEDDTENESVNEAAKFQEGDIVVDGEGKRFRIYNTSPNWIAIIPEDGEIEDKIKIPVGDFYEEYKKDKKTKSVNESVNISYLLKLIDDNNTQYGTDFRIEQTYGGYDLWAGSNRIESGSKQDVYNAFVKNRFNEKYRTKNEAFGDSDKLKGKYQVTIKFTKGPLKGLTYTRIQDDKPSKEVYTNTIGGADYEVINVATI